MSEVADDRLVAILQHILRRTRHKKIEWQRGDVGGIESFYYHMPNSSLEIRSSAGGGFPPFIFSVRDSLGSILESLETDVWDNPNYNESLTELYRLARRQSLQVDETLDQLLADLQKEERNET